MNTQPTPRHWSIVGGGMLGMTVALRLAQAGQRVTLYEAADHLGGLADAWQVGDITWDRHYHVTLLSDAHLRSILGELDLDQDMQWVETRTGFFTDGQLHSMSNAWEFLRFPPLGLIEKLRLGATIWYASKINNWQGLEQVHVADWLRRLSGRRTFEKIWLPLLRAKLGENYRITSAAFIWATIARLYAARRTGLKKELFGYLPGGYARLLKSFREKLESLGVDIRLNHRVRQVTRRGGSVRIDFAGQQTYASDLAVLTTPSSVVTRVCPDLNTDEKRRHEGVLYQGIVCASFLLRRPLAGYYVTDITEHDIPFTGVIEMTAMVDRATFGGHTLVYLPKYVAVNDPAFEQSDAVIHAEFLAGLRRIFPDLSDDDVLACRISRVRHVMAISTLHYSENLPSIKTSIPGVFALNSAQIVNGTLNVNETVRLAEWACQTLLLPATAMDNGLESAAVESTTSRMQHDQDNREPIAGP